jgi:hypothetical protein
MKFNTKLTVEGVNTKVTGNYGAFNLDAALAHAMYVAMSDLDSSGDISGISFTLRQVEIRADELLRE